MHANQVKALAELIDRDGLNEVRISSAKVADALTECRKDAVRLVVYEHCAKNLKGELKKSET